MKQISKLILSLGALVFSVANADTEFSADKAFGAAMPAAGDAVTLTQAIDRLDSRLNSSAESLVKIQGQITEVCQAKGCWMILVDGDTYARVTFEDYGFFVPIDTSMQRSVVYGVLTESVLTGAQAEHFAQDAGSQSTLALEGEVKEYSIVARAVQLENHI
jgi:hypothetical protein